MKVNSLSVSLERTAIFLFVDQSAVNDPPSWSHDPGEPVVYQRQLSEGTRLEFIDPTTGAPAEAYRPEGRALNDRLIWKAIFSDKWSKEHKGAAGALFPAHSRQEKIDPDEKPLGFPIENKATSVEMIENQFDRRSTEAVKSLYRQHKQELAVIVKAHREGSIPAQEFENIKTELRLNYMDSCRDIWTDEQFELLFGSVEN